MPISFPTDLTFDGDSGFAVRVNTDRVPPRLQQRVHDALTGHKQMVAAARSALGVLRSAAHTHNEIDALAHRYTPEGVQGARAELRTQITPKLGDPRHQLRTILNERRADVGSLTFDTIAADFIIAYPSKVVEAAAAVQMLPKSALRQAAEQAMRKEDLAAMIAVHQRAANDEKLSDDERESVLGVFGEYVAPAREALQEIARASEVLWAYIENGVDEVAAYPTAPDAMRILQRSNGAAPSPALDPTGAGLDPMALLAGTIPARDTARTTLTRDDAPPAAA